MSFIPDRPRTVRPSKEDEDVKKKRRAVTLYPEAASGAQWGAGTVEEEQARRRAMQPAVMSGPAPGAQTGAGTPEAEQARRAAVSRALSEPIPQPETAYDLRRQVIEAEGSEERTDQEKALARRLAAQGLGAGSGILEKATQEQDIEQRKREAARLGGIDIEELQAGERKGESALDRALTREIEAGRMTLAEKQMVQQASQFKSEQEWRTWAIERGYDEDAITRAWQTSERLGAQQYQASRELEPFQLALISTLDPDDKNFLADLTGILNADSIEDYVPVSRQATPGGLTPGGQVVIGGKQYEVLSQRRPDGSYLLRDAAGTLHVATQTASGAWTASRFN